MSDNESVVLRKPLELRDGQPVCRICYNGNDEERLLSPCKCAGSVQHVHQSCLLKWLQSRTFRCELCQYKYRALKKTRNTAERERPSITGWQIFAIIKVIIVLDWFHFLETVFLCISLCVVNHMNSSDLVYQVSLIGAIELFYYLANFLNSFFLLYYYKWSLLNQTISVLNHGEKRTDYEDQGIILKLIDWYASLLGGYKRIMDVVEQIE